MPAEGEADMVTRRGKRLDRAYKQLSRVPVPAEVLDAAVARFRSTGRLPDIAHFAGAVTNRILTDYPAPKAERSPEELLVRFKEWHRAKAERRPTPVDDRPLTVREHLFDEAVYGPRFVRRVGRAALRSVVRNGGDVTAHDLLQDRGLPERGTVGMHVLRVYERVARPPFEERGQDVLERYGDVMDRLQARGARSLGELEAAMDTFVERGEMPPSALLSEGVLAALELEALVHHWRGADVTDLLFLLDVADEDEALRTKALQAIPRLVRRGYRRRQS